jgi:hypothetical protein
MPSTLVPRRFEIWDARLDWPLAKAPALAPAQGLSSSDCASARAAPRSTQMDAPEERTFSRVRDCRSR